MAKDSDKSPQNRESAPAGPPEFIPALTGIAPNDDVTVEEGQVYVEVNVSGGTALGVYAIAFPHLSTPTNAEPEPDQQIYWIGGTRYASLIPYPTGELFRVRFRADFENEDPVEPPVVTHASIGSPDGFDD